MWIAAGFARPNSRDLLRDFFEADEYIINGDDVDKGKWPWMLSLQVFDPEFRHTCGAALLDERHALTAGYYTYTLDLLFKKWVIFTGLFTYTNDSISEQYESDYYANYWPIFQFRHKNHRKIRSEWPLSDHISDVNGGWMWIFFLWLWLLMCPSWLAMAMYVN